MIAGKRSLLTAEACSAAPQKIRATVVFRSEGPGVGWTVLDRDRPLLLAGISQGDYAEITGLARTRKFSRGEMLSLEGDSVRQVVLLTSGLVKITKLGSSGAEVILRLNGPGDLLGATDMYLMSSHGATSQAFRLCQALVWEAPVFRALLERYPILHQNMARILGRQLLDLEDRFREVATERVGQRVARQVLRLAEQIGRSVNGAIEIELSRQELAQMTGTTLFTVSRLFSTWEALQILKPRREAVAICDLPGLRIISSENLGDALAG